MTSPIRFYPLNGTLSDEDFGSPTLSQSVTFAKNSAIDISQGVQGTSGGDGFHIDYQFTGRGTVTGVFDFSDVSDGTLMGQHDGTQGVAVIVQDACLALKVDATVVVVRGVLTDLPQRIGVSWDENETALVLDGLVEANIQATPTLPADDFYILASSEGSNGVNANASYVAAYNAFIGYRQTKKITDPKSHVQRELDAGFLGDPNYADVNLLINGVSSSIQDGSPNGYVLTNTGAVLFEDQKKFGSPSIDASAGYFTVGSPSTDLIEWNAGDYTIEAWVYRTASVPGGGSGGSVPTLAGNMSGTSPTSHWAFGVVGDTLRFAYSNGAVVTVDSTTSIPLEQWTHIAMTQVSGTIALYVNGVPDTTAAVSGTPTFNGAGVGFSVGRHDAISGGYYFDQLRSSKIAQYTAAFNVPNEIFYNFLAAPGSGPGNLLFAFDGDLDNTGDDTELGYAAGTSPESHTYTAEITGNYDFQVDPDGNGYLYTPGGYSTITIDYLDLDREFFLSVRVYLGPGALLPGEGNKPLMMTQYNGPNDIIYISLNSTGEQDTSLATIGFGAIWQNYTSSGFLTPQEEWFDFAIQRDYQNGDDNLRLFVNGQQIQLIDADGLTFNCFASDPADNSFQSTTVRLGLALNISSWLEDAAFQNFRYYTEAIVDEPAAGYDPNNAYLEASVGGNPPIFDAALGNGLWLQPVPAFFGDNGIDGYGQIIGYNPQSDDPAFRAPASYAPFNVNPASSGSDYMPIMFETEDPWVSKDNHIQGILSMADTRHGSIRARTFTDGIDSYRAGKITGSVVDEFSAPVARIIRAQERTTGILVKEQWASADGSYSFRDLDINRKYTIIGHDYTGTYNAVIKDDVTPIIDEAP